MDSAKRISSGTPTSRSCLPPPSLVGASPPWTLPAWPNGSNRTAATLLWGQHHNTTAQALRQLDADDETRVVGGMAFKAGSTPALRCAPPPSAPAYCCSACYGTHGCQLACTGQCRVWPWRWRWPWRTADPKRVGLCKRAEAPPACCHAVRERHIACTSLWGFVPASVCDVRNAPTFHLRTCVYAFPFRFVHGRRLTRFPRVLHQPPRPWQILITGQGRNFCAGIDVGYLQRNFLSLTGGAPAAAGGGAVGGGGPGDDGRNGGGSASCPGRQRAAMRRSILALQVRGWPVHGGLAASARLRFTVPWRPLELCCRRGWAVGLGGASVHARVVRRT